MVHAAPRTAGPRDVTLPRKSAAELAPTALKPMLASVATDVPGGDGWVFEPKYDGIRVLAHAGTRGVHLVTRNGKDKSHQFPEVVAALEALVTRTGRAVILDGEIVALVNGEPARFQRLQSRMHATADIAGHAGRAPAAFIAFDLLRDGDDVLLREPWTERRARLAKRLRSAPPHLRLGDSQEGDSGKMLSRARVLGWEGLMAKKASAPYQPGRRSADWVKLKLEARQEFVVGGFTEPRQSRQHIGALLLGYYDGDRLIYAGHAGGGFSVEGLRDMYRRLAPIERKTSPFAEAPKSNEPAHWVTPRVVVEVKFNEWTNDGKLRQPVFLGVRDDKEARDVTRERPGMERTSRARRADPTPATRRRASPGSAVVRAKKPAAGADALLAALTALEESGGSGLVRVGSRQSITVSSLDKIYFPDAGVTKGALMRYYARVAPVILAVTRDRPLVLKRFPNGVKGKFFFQQNAPEDAPPAVRVETVTNDEGERQRRFVGGDLATLLYTVQLGSISVDPWHGRVGALEYADYTILDLDPGPRAPFQRVVDVARWVREVMESYGLRGCLKTSGSRGLHVYLPLPPRTTHESALLAAQLVATRVAQLHPRDATVARSVKARKPGAVYVDYLQNIRAKTVAAAYAARATPGALVSTPLRWSELTDDLDPEEFTIETVPARLASVGDLWAAGMRARNSLRALAGGAPAKRGRDSA